MVKELCCTITAGCIRVDGNVTTSKVWGMKNSQTKAYTRATTSMGNLKGLESIPGPMDNFMKGSG